MGPAGRFRTRYYAYRVSTSLGFYIPVSVVYLRDSGFGLAFVAIAQSAFSFALLLAEIPTGYLGDRIGRRAALVLGSVCRVVALLGYVVADSAAAFLALKVVLATGWALRSGTTDAFLYDRLAAAGASEEFAAVQGRSSSLLLAASSATALLGSYLYTVEAALPFLLNAGLAAAGAPILLSFGRGAGVREVDADAEAEVDDPEAAAAVDGDAADAPPAADPFTIREAKAVLGDAFRRPETRWLVLYSVLVFGAFDLSRTFEQPALRSVGVPVAAFGLLFAGFKIVSAGAAAAVGTLTDRLGSRRVLGLAAPVVAVFYGAVLVTPLALVPALFLYRSLRTLIRPVRNQYLNDRLPAAGRATVLSGVSMLLSLFSGVARLAAGAVAAETGPVVVLGLVGVVLAVAAGGVWLATSPVRPSGDSTPDPRRRGVSTD